MIWKFFSSASQRSAGTSQRIRRTPGRPRRLMKARLRTCIRVPFWVSSHSQSAAASRGSRPRGSGRGVRSPGRSRAGKAPGRFQSATGSPLGWLVARSAAGPCRPGPGRRQSRRPSVPPSNLIGTGTLKPVRSTEPHSPAAGRHRHRCRWASAKGGRSRSARPRSCWFARRRRRGVAGAVRAGHAAAATVATVKEQRQTDREQQHHGGDRSDQRQFAVLRRPVRLLRHDGGSSGARWHLGGPTLRRRVLPVHPPGRSGSRCSEGSRVGPGAVGPRRAGGRALRPGPRRVSGGARRVRVRRRRGCARGVDLRRCGSVDLRRRRGTLGRRRGGLRRAVPAPRAEPDRATRGGRGASLLWRRMSSSEIPVRALRPTTLRRSRSAASASYCSAGFFCSSPLMTGLSGPPFFSGGGGSVASAVSVPIADCRAYGDCALDRRVEGRAERPQVGLRPDAPSRARSGAMYAGEPSTRPVRVTFGSPGSVARPKSVSTTRPSSPSSTLPGLTSRCSTPAWCAALSAPSTPSPISAARRTETGPSSAGSS